MAGSTAALPPPSAACRRSGYRVRPDGARTEGAARGDAPGLYGDRAGSERGGTLEDGNGR